MFPNSLTSPNGPSPWLTYLGPLLLSILAAWTSINFFAGGVTTQVSAHESAIKEQKETNKTFTTREETRIANESILRELNSIHDDVRTIQRAVK